ncbi:MAG: hypothetical protein WC349_02020 [Patescibacteria group bacterium]|jgi:hypothetical protein
MKIKRFTFIIVLVSSFLFTPFAAKLYLLIFGLQKNAWWGPSNPEYFLGFLMNLVFFGSFFSWLLNNKWKISVYYTLPVILFFSNFEIEKYLILIIVLAVTGFVLAQFFLLIKEKIFKIKIIESSNIPEYVFVNKNKTDTFGAIQIILIIYLSIEFFIGLLFGLYNFNGSLIFAIVKLTSLFAIAPTLYYLMKKDTRCYLYICIFAGLNIISQFFNYFGLAIFVMCIILFIFSIYKLNIIKIFNRTVGNSDIDQVMISVLIMSLLFKTPIFILAVLSFAELFGSLF